jgi:hypothetical protein
LNAACVQKTDRKTCTLQDGVQQPLWTCDGTPACDCGSYAIVEAVDGTTGTGLGNADVFICD